MLLKIIQFIMIWLWENSEGTSCCFNLSSMGSASPTCHGSTSAVMWNTYHRGWGVINCRQLRRYVKEILPLLFHKCERVSESRTKPGGLLREGRRWKWDSVRHTRSHTEAERSNVWSKDQTGRNQYRIQVEQLLHATVFCLCNRAAKMNLRFTEECGAQWCWSAVITNLHMGNRAYRIHL